MWEAKTDAQLHSRASFAAYKAEHGLVLLGLMGYAGNWRRSGLSGDALTAFVADARRSLAASLEAAQREHGDALVMVSGATKIGVLELGYELCAQLGIVAMGITSGRARRYRLGKMAHLIVIGARFGDESACFVELCDHFVVLGGGPQSQRECEHALALAKPVVAITGFGGAADELATNEALIGRGLRVVEGRASGAC